jgi:hypothetical protein
MFEDTKGLSEVVNLRRTGRRRKVSNKQKQHGLE